MSTEAEGSAPSYHDSVREMMLELKKNKSSNKSSTNAAKSSTGNNEEKCEQVLVRNFFHKNSGDLNNRIVWYFSSPPMKGSVIQAMV